MELYVIFVSRDIKENLVCIADYAILIAVWDASLDNNIIISSEVINYVYKNFVIVLLGRASSVHIN